MAPRKAAALTPKQTQAKHVNILSDRVRLLYRVIIVLGSLLAAVGCAGLLVLLDNPTRSQWYSHTQFAEWWRWMTEKNPMFTNVCFNGGLVCVLLSFVRLHEDKKALKALDNGKKKK